MSIGLIEFNYRYKLFDMHIEHGKIQPLLIKGFLFLVVALFFSLVGIAVNYLSWQTVLLLVLGLIGAVIIYRRLFWGLLLFVFLIPSEVLFVLSGGSSLLRYIGLIISIIWLLELLIKRRSINFNKLSLPYLMFFCWGILSLFWAPIPGEGFRYAITFLQLGLLIIIIIDQVRSLNHLKAMIGALAAGGIFIIIVYYSLGEFSDSGRFIISLSHYRGLAVYGYPLAFSVTLLGVLAILGKNSIRFIGAAGYVAGLFPLIGSGLRGGLLATIMGICVATIINTNKKRWGIILSIIVIALLLGSINYLNKNEILPYDLTQRLSISSSVESGGSNRLNIWFVAGDVFKQNPIFGLGLNQFASFVFLENLYSAPVGTHNDYLEALVSLGLVGAFLLIIGEILLLVKLFKVRHHLGLEDILWYGAIIALLIASIVGQNFVNQIYWKYVWVIRAIAISGIQLETWRRDD